MPLRLLLQVMLRQLPLQVMPLRPLLQVMLLRPKD